MPKLRKPLNLLLTFVIILSVFTIAPFTASAETTQIYARKWVKADLVEDGYYSFSDLYQNFIICRVWSALFSESDLNTTQDAVNMTTDEMSPDNDGKNEIILGTNGQQLSYTWNYDEAHSGDGKIYLTAGDFDVDGLEWVAYTWETFTAQKVDAAAPTYRYISRMINQISKNEEMFEFYNDLLQYDRNESETNLTKEIYIKQANLFYKSIPGACNAADLIRATYEASPKGNRSILLGVMKPQMKMTLFKGDLTAIPVKLEPEDRLILYSNR